MFPFFNSFLQSPYQADRKPGQLYYKNHLLDQDKTPRQYISDFPELRSYLPMLLRLGFADTPLKNICAAKGLQSVQNLIDRTCR